jgi:hypothetical protein
MELPDDVLALVRAYAKPSEPYKMYARVLKILVNHISPCIIKTTARNLKSAVMFNYYKFLPVFLELERKHHELVVSSNAVCINDTSIYTVSQLRMEYYRKVSNFTYTKCDVLNELKKL